MTTKRSDSKESDTPDPFKRIENFIREGQPGAAIETLYFDLLTWLTQVIYQASGGSLQAADVGTAVTDCLVALARRFAATDFDPSNVKAYIKQVARSKGQGVLRSWLRQQFRTTTDEVTEDLIPVVDPGASGEQLAWQELLDQIEGLLSDLPGKQQLVARLWLKNVTSFLDGTDYLFLAELVSAQTGEPEDPDAIRITWAAAKAKLRDPLRRAGYHGSS